MYAVHLFFLCQFTDQSTTNWNNFDSQWSGSTWSTWSTWFIFSTRSTRYTKYTWSSVTELYIYTSINQTSTTSTNNHTSNHTANNNHTATSWLVSVYVRFS